MLLFVLNFRRIIWLGDLNYRVNLSYEKAHELISKQDWAGLFEEDQVISWPSTLIVTNFLLIVVLWQLRREFGEGCTFDGWFEGVISFPPTYKYEFGSENYVGDEPKSGRRTPAWYAVLSSDFCSALDSFYSI
jgi:type I inositol polyphosphate 5-phosphatase IP5P1/2